MTVCEWEDGTLEILDRGRELGWQEIETRPGKPAVAAANKQRPRPPAATQMPNHPWRRSYQDMQALGSPKRGVDASATVASASASP